MSKESLMRKIRALAEQGVGGERESASEIMNRLMEKYGITELDMEEEEVALHWFGYGKDLHGRLLAQIIFGVTGKRDIYSRLDALGRRVPSRRESGAYCTDSQRIEIEYSFGFYSAAYDEEFEIFHLAFIHKHDLFPPEAHEGRSDLSIEQLAKIAAMMGTLDDRRLRKALPDGGGTGDQDGC